MRSWQASALEHCVLGVCLSDLNQACVGKVEVVDRKGDDRKVMTRSTEEVAEGISQVGLALPLKEKVSGSASLRG